MGILDTLSGFLGPALAGVGTAVAGPAGGIAGGILGSSLQAAPGAPASGGGILGSLFGGGPGRGQIRRTGAKQAVDGSPGLTFIRQSVARAIGPVGGKTYTGRATAADFAAVIRAAVQSQPAAQQDLLAVLGRANQLGGFGKMQGVEANTLGDVLKYTFGLGLVPPAGAPTVRDILAALGGNPPAPTLPLPPASGTVGLPSGYAGPSGAASLVDSPQSQLAALRDFVTAGDVPAAPEENMGTFLDSAGSFLGGIAQGFLQSTGPSGPSPFVLPGGMPSSIGMQVGGILPGLLGLGNYQVGPNVLGGNVSGGGGGMTAGIGAGSLATLDDPFRLTATGGARAQVFVQANPVTGRAEWFGPLGRPILFSRDRAVVRRVSRLAMRLSSATGHRRLSAGRRRRGGR